MNRCLARFLSVFLIALGAAFVGQSLVHAGPLPPGMVRIEVFERQDCAHCQAEKAFLEDIKTERDDFEVIYHDIAEPKERERFNQLTDLERIPKVTPTTLIGGAKLIQGFSTAETTGARFIELIDQYKDKTQYTFEEFIARGGSQGVETGGEGATCEIGGSGCGAEPFLVNVPLVGPVDVMKYSLPVLAVILGFVDGFNPCAMWVLVMLLTLLIQAGSKRRMWEMAGLFILAETIMYYLILNVWMTTWDFIGMDRIVTPLVGLVSVGAGGYFLKEFFWGDNTCKVGDLNSKKKIHQKIQHYATAPMTILTALGILGLAFSVNILEFACSIGIPQAFTKILDLNALSWLGRQFYMFLYILFYMVDDFVVFGVALYSFEKIGLTTQKYTRMSHLIGGIIMVILGLLFLFKPTALVFG